MLRRRRAGEPRRLEAAPRPGWGSAICHRDGARAACVSAAAGLCISVVAGASEAASEAAGAVFCFGFRSAGDSQNVI